tara:strand:+ start:2668 stop:3615 length:948 start_codon:yes stop_codon:yes gene_type:complete
MSSHSDNDNPKPHVPTIDELNLAHVDTGLTKRATAKNVAMADIKDIDIRNWCVQWRSSLIKGERIPVVIDNVKVAEITKPMLKVTSSKIEDLYKGGQVELPKDTEKDGVVRLLEYLQYVARTTKKPVIMNRGMTTFEALSVCAAAALLGMDKYVNHIYKMCEYKLRADPPTYEDIDAITAFAKSHARLFKIVVNYLATLVWDDEIPDPEVFKAYLAENPTLDKAIIQANNAYTAKLRMEKDRAHQKEVEQNQAALAKEKEQQEKARWAEKNAKRARLEKSCREKLQGPLEKRQKFTPEERSHWITTRRVQPPNGC